MLITSYREYLSIDFGCRLMPYYTEGQAETCPFVIRKG
nr:MAG TPA: hypothetical protein [Caudoviricetes sp.]DAZ53056.1 MAG TPA: hypothetical protein [Caudoviricetes sp.]